MRWRRYRWLMLVALAAAPIGLYWRITYELSWRPVTLQTGGVVTRLAYLSDGHTLLTVNDGQDFRWWDIQSKRLLRQVAIQHPFDDEMCWSPNHKHVAYVTSGDTNDPCTVFLWDVTTVKMHRPFNIPDAFCIVQFAPDGKTIASGSGRSGSVRLRSVETGKLLRTFPSDIDRVFALAFSPDGRSLAASGRDGSIEVFDTRQSHVRWRVPGSMAVTDGLLFSPDGQVLARVSDNVQLWDAHTGRFIRTIHAGVGRLQIAFSPDSKLLASGISGGAVYLWDVASAKLVRVLNAHDSTISAIAFSPDGRSLSSGCTNGTVRLWRVN